MEKELEAYVNWLKSEIARLESDATECVEIENGEEDRYIFAASAHKDSLQALKEFGLLTD